MPTGKASPKTKIVKTAPAAKPVKKAATKAKPAVKAAALPKLKAPAKAVKKSSGAEPAKSAASKAAIKTKSKAVVAPVEVKKPIAKPKAIPFAAKRVDAPAKTVATKISKPKSVPIEKVADEIVEPATAITVPEKVPVVPQASKKASGTRVVANDEAKSLDKYYTDLLGISQPKGRGLNFAGEPLKPEELAAQGFCVMQFPPRPGRLSWIYATHGLSTVNAKGKDQPARVELVMHWRERENSAVQVLTDAANHLLQSGADFAPGEILSDAQGMHINPNEITLKHFMTFTPDPFMPKALDLPGGAVRPVFLLGISDAELESATKVRPELADGKTVLLDALRKGGVFPVTDPKRQCLTRRRDFLRIWEAAFRAARERKI